MLPETQQVIEQSDTPPPPAPVEVDIDKGEATEIAAPQPVVQEPPKVKTPPRHEQRIRNIAAERDSARGYAQQLQTELEQARREAAENKAAKEQAERAGMENYSARVTSDVNAAKAAVKAAKESQDADAEIEATQKLAKASAAEADVDAWRATQPKPGEQPARQDPPARAEPPRQQPQPAQLSEPVLNFMQDNSWFNAVQVGTDGRPVVDPNTKRMVPNQDFDADMHDAAIREHQRIDSEIRRGKLAKDFVESDEYFDRIRNQVVTEFPEAFGEEEAAAPPPARKTPPMSQARQPVAPVARQSQPGSTKQPGTKIQLDGEQASLVRSLVDNGTMTYPRNHPDVAKRGTKMTYNDAYIQYAKNAKDDQANRS